MKSLKFKLLCAALAAAGGIQMAHAQCPTTPTAWEQSVPVTSAAGTFAITTPGLSAGTVNGGLCKFDVGVTAAAARPDRARVQDRTPADETRYRARFLVNVDSLGTMGPGQRVKLFNVQSTVDPDAAGQAASIGMVLVRLQGNPDGSGGRGIIVRGGNFTGQTAPFAAFNDTAFIPLAAGTNRVELDLQVAAANTGSLRIWVNSSTEGSPTASLNALNLIPWNPGVTQVNLGLIEPTFDYINGAGAFTSKAGIRYSVDEFESRRQTFIGG